MIEYHAQGSHTIVEMDDGGRFRTIRVEADGDRIALALTADLEDGRVVECVWRMTPAQARWLMARLEAGGEVTPDEAKWLT